MARAFLDELDEHDAEYVRRTLNLMNVGPVILE
ncbi:MAG: hypothetical protein QOE41_1534 [Mycobacterium sp.]|nr:hypothetical protein [Mycobacterium sp.]